MGVEQLVALVTYWLASSNHWAAFWFIRYQERLEEREDVGKDTTNDVGKLVKRQRL